MATDEFERRLEEEKLASLQALAYGLSHEINNPLANISMRAQALLAGETDAKKRELLLAIYRQAMRAHAMIADTMTYARPPAPNLAEVELVALAKAAVADVKEAAEVQGTRVFVSGDAGPVVIQADANQLLLAVRALLDNALEALVRGGQIEVGVREGTVFVRDSGPGMSDEVRRHCLDPFYSGREAGRGLGFGLPKCWAIMKQHGGEVEIESTAGAGTRVTLWITH